MAAAEGEEHGTGPGLVARLIALKGVAPKPVLHVVFRSTRRPEGGPVETFEIAGEPLLPGAAALDNWLARRLPGVDRLAVSVLVVRETLDDRGMIAQCTLERRRGALDGPFYGEPARVDFAGPASTIRLYRAHLDGRLTEVAPSADSAPLRSRPPEQFAGEHKALQARFGTGLRVLDSREPTLFEDMVGLSTIVHLRTTDGRDVACGIGWHGNVPFVLEADFPRFASPLELPPDEEAAVQAALRDEDLVRGETRLDEAGIAIIARRRGSDSLFVLRPAFGAVRLEPHSPNRDAAGPDQQRWMNYAESYEGLTVLDAWHDGTTEDVMVLTGDLSGQVWRHHVDIDGVETWRKTDDEAAIGAVHREHLFPGTLAAADTERAEAVQAAAPVPSVGGAASDGSLLGYAENYVRAMSALRAARDTVDGLPDVALTHVRELCAALSALDAHVTAAMARQLLGRLDAAALSRIEEPLRQELASFRCIMIPPSRAGLLEVGLDMAAEFAAVAYDAEEAAICLALRRPTATVFHCAKVLEGAIAALARTTGLPDPLASGERDWQAIQRRFRGVTKADLLPALDALEAVRKRWRAASLAPADKYTEEEAERIFQAICTFVNAVNALDQSRSQRL